MRGHEPDEQMACRCTRAAALEVREDCVPDLLRQRQTRFASAFASDANGAVSPLDVRELQTDDIACTQAESRPVKDMYSLIPFAEMGMILPLLSSHGLGVHLSMWLKRLNILVDRVVQMMELN